MTNAGFLWSSGMRGHLGKTSKTPRSDAAHRSSQQVFGEMRASDPFAEELRGVGATRSARAARTERPSVSERRGGRHGQRGGVAGAIWGMTRDTQVDAAADTLPQAVSADAARPPTAMGSEEEDEIDFGEGTDIDLAGALVKIWSEESDDSERSPKRGLPPTSPCSCPQPVSTHRRALCPTQRRRRSWPPRSLRRPLQLSRKPMRAVLLVEGVALLRPPSSPPPTGGGKRSALGAVRGTAAGWRLCVCSWAIRHEASAGQACWAMHDHMLPPQELQPALEPRSHTA